MGIKRVTIYDLKSNPNSEGLVLQGCGGPLKDWVDGINEILTKEEILKNNFQFQNVSTFRNQGVTCLLFPFDNESDVDIGKLSIWRIKNHENFGATWLSDYVMNYLGGYDDEILDENPSMQLQ